MITKKVIEVIYKKYRKRPASIDCIDIGHLFDTVSEVHSIEIIDDHIVIGSLDSSSIFHKISLHRVHGIENFEETVAIVLHSSILFLNKKENKVSIHVKPQPKTFFAKLKMWFSH